MNNSDGASVSQVSISPDETKVVVSSSSNFAKLFDLNTGRLIAVLGGFDQMVSSVDFSADGSRIAVGSYDATAKIYTEYGGLIAKLALPVNNRLERSLHRIQFSADASSVLATAVFVNPNTYFWTIPTEVNKDVLKEVIAEATGIDKALYTPDSIDKLTAVLEDANSVLASNTANDDEIEACANKIKNTVYSLQRIPGGKAVLNGFEKWTTEGVQDMSVVNAKGSMVSTEVALTPNVTKSLCINASTTRAWSIYNYDSDKQIVGQNPFGADLSNSDGICFWAKGVTKSQENGRVCIGYTGTEGSFMFEANLPTITTEGLYVKIPFSAFTHVSGEETLDLKKLNTIGFYGKGEKGMFIFTELTAYSEVGEAPVISGVDEGASYDITNGEAPKASWDNGFATLDGNVYEKGTPITEAGEHTLTVNNRGTQVSVSFSVVDNTADPIISGVRDREVFDIAKGESVSASWDVGEGELNGEAVSSVAISEVGEYTLTVRNGYKSESVYFVVIDTSADVPMYIKGDFDGDEKITVADALAALRIAARIAECSDTELLIGDIDADGEITVADALAILRVAAKMSDSL